MKTRVAYRLCILFLVTFASAVRASESSDSSAPNPIAAIDGAIIQGWKESGLTPSAPASDREFCRRLFLDVLGRIPTMDELDSFLRDKRPDRKARLVDRLLDDPQYTVDYARHWSTIWANLMVGRTPERRNSPVSRAGLEKFLRDEFSRNRPYHDLVAALVTASGTNQPGSPNFNGAVNYLSGKLDENATQATAHTFRLFLGLQVQCTQCHNHPFNSAKQSQFWQLNAFFRQMTIRRTRREGVRDVLYTELADVDFLGEDRPRDPKQARVYFEQRNGKLEAAFPVFLDGTRIDPSGYVQDVNRRGELAKLMLQSPYFATALVNRMWAHFLGYGFTQPVDDLGPHNRRNFPDLLDELSSAFVASDYDLKQLIRWIVLSRPYSLSSRMVAGNERDDPTTGVPPSYARFYVRQMTAEQLYRSLLIASEADKTHGSPDSQQQAQERWLEQFTIAFGTDEGDETTTFNGTITQSLMMFNGDLMDRATAGRAGSFLHRIVHDARIRPTAKVQRLFLAALARPATKMEQKAYQELLVYHQHDALLALQDLWWAVLNSNEFILNH